VIVARRQSGYGLLIDLDHQNGFVTRYAHAGELFVKEGDAVRRGQLMARVGSSGRVTAPHLHYEVRRAGVAVNPERFLAVRIGEPG
jgi:murein DD-endopeptidase MepM/ murein hydrolase activator NlpD